MSRRRAGSAWTSVYVGDKLIALMLNAEGRWITTGEAQGWTRCRSCRVPFERPAVPEEPRLCGRCFWSLVPVKVYWEHHPIKRQTVAEHSRWLNDLHAIQDAIKADGPRPRWRSIVRAQRVAPTEARR